MKHLIEQTIDKSNKLKKNRGRPAQHRYIFDENHPQKSTHILIERVAEVIPDLIGPQIPRRDREETRERYCRAIVTLFVPWRSFIDLCSPDESWTEAWTKHQAYISGSECEDIIENIELLHECKEHRNEHLTQVIEQLDNKNVEPPFYACLDKDSDDVEDELDVDLSNILNMWDNLSDFGVSKDIDFVNKAIDDLIQTNRFIMNSCNNANLQLEDIILKPNFNDLVTNKTIYYNIRSLIPATKKLHQKNKEWQLALKMEKDNIKYVKKPYMVIQRTFQITKLPIIFLLLLITLKMFLLLMLLLVL